MITDIKINLLPWREEVREEKKKEFLKITRKLLVGMRNLQIKEIQLPN